MITFASLLNLAFTFLFQIPGTGAGKVENAAIGGYDQTLVIAVSVGILILLALVFRKSLVSSLRTARGVTENANFSGQSLFVHVGVSPELELEHQLTRHYSQLVANSLTEQGAQFYTPPTSSEPLYLGSKLKLEAPKDIFEDHVLHITVEASTDLAEPRPYNWPTDAFEVFRANYYNPLAESMQQKQTTLGSLPTATEIMLFATWKQLPGNEQFRDAQPSELRKAEVRKDTLSLTAQYFHLSLTNHKPFRKTISFNWETPEERSQKAAIAVSEVLSEVPCIKLPPSARVIERTLVYDTVPQTQENAQTVVAQPTTVPAQVPVQEQATPTPPPAPTIPQPVNKTPINTGSLRLRAEQQAATATAGYTNGNRPFNVAPQANVANGYHKPQASNPPSSKDAEWGEIIQLP